MGEVLDLDGLPDDPIDRLAALLDIEADVRGLLDTAYARAYFDARITGQIESAIALSRHSRGDIFAMTRQLNREGGGAIRWGDGVDPKSSAYSAD